MSYYYNSERVDVDILIGKTLVDVQIEDKSEIHFRTTEGENFVMYHEQDCCENVRIEDMNGDISDLIYTPILMAEKVSQAGDEDDWGSSTWTFYKIATIKGTVVIRWLGESNGYYSESVDFVKLKEEIQ